MKFCYQLQSIISALRPKDPACFCKNEAEGTCRCASPASAPPARRVPPISVPLADPKGARGEVLTNETLLRC